MQRFIKGVLKNATSNTTVAQSLGKLVQMRRDPGWPVFAKLLEEMKKWMSEDVLSKQFTKLDPHEKDIRQKTYRNIRLVLDFLESPDKALAEELAKESGPFEVISNPHQQQKRDSVSAIRR